MWLVLLLFVYSIPLHIHTSALAIATAKSNRDGRIALQKNVEMPFRRSEYIVEYHRQHGYNFHSRHKHYNPIRHSRHGHFHRTRHYNRLHRNRISNKVRLEHQYRKIKSYRNSIAKYREKMKRNSQIIHRLRSKLSSDVKHVASYRRRIPYLFVKIHILKRTIHAYRQRIGYYTNRLHAKRLLVGSKVKNNHKKANGRKAAKSNSGKSQKAKVGKLRKLKTVVINHKGNRKSKVKAGSHGTQKPLLKNTHKTPVLKPQITQAKGKSVNIKKPTVPSKLKTTGRQGIKGMKLKGGKAQTKHKSVTPNAQTKKQAKAKAGHRKKLHNTVGKKIRGHLHKTILGQILHPKNLKKKIKHFSHHHNYGF